ncbi:MAG: hypothetical protein CMP67_04955 [Flavobacteriales bacterium]|nr:hypothetical protein [Flavobacteriales bacterium]|tara:strand:- start:6948 stop:10268 length:3321 start_codon:yes stop_codon:yes gene_type:complete
MKKIFAILCVLATQIGFAQSDYTFTTSKEYFNEAYEHFGQEEYKEAFASFEKINKSDTLYELAQLNKLICEFTSEYYKSAVKTGTKMIKEGSQYSAEAYYYKINGLIQIKEFENVSKCIDEGSIEYPLYKFRFEYLRAKMLEEQEKYEEAKEILQSIIIQHPHHSASHLLLAQIMGDEGGEIQAILGFQMAIISNRNSNSLKEAFRGMNDMMQSNFEINREKEDNKEYKQINSLISSGLALKADYKTDIPLRYISNAVTDLIFKQFSYKSKSDDFTMKYYGKFLNEIKNKGLEKGYILYVMSVINNPYVKKVISTYKNNFDAFEKFNTEYWENQINSNKFKVNGEIDERDYIMDSRGILKAFGKINKKDFREGKWTYLYPSGKISAETEYNEKGKLIGENIWYSQDGYIKESGIYKDGVLNGHAYFTRDNGCSNYGGEFLDGELNGEIKIYNSQGIFYLLKNFKENKLDGKVQEFYTNGELYSEVNVVKGLNEGNLYVFGPLGDTLKIINYSKGKPTGSYIEYHINGNIASEGKFKGGQRYGTWKDYYYDGSLAYKYNYKGGSFHGDYVQFDKKGDTLVYRTYNNGLLHGVDKDYTNDNRVLWEHVFKKGKLKKYYNYGPNGELLSSGKKEYVLNDRFGYKYIEGTKKGNKFHGEYTVYFKNGNVSEKRNYVKGVLSGEYKEYYSWGGIDQEMYYKDDKLHGEYKSYYDNGKKHAEGQYVEGEKAGLWKYYHPNGNLYKEVYFIDGKSDGHVTIYSITGEKRSNYFYKGDVLYKTEVFDKDGNVICDIKTPQGKGEYVFKSTAGHLYLKSKLDGGEHHGTKTFYYPNGQTLEKSQKNYGESHGMYRSYFPDGSLKEEGEYVYGKRKGEWKTYHHNGKLAYKAFYELDVAQDSVMRYYISGGIKEITYYDKNGDVIGEKYFHPNGALNSFAPMEGDFTHGEFCNYDAFGKIVIKRKYNGGEMVAYSYLKNGKLIEPIVINGNGDIKTYFDDGNVASSYSEKNGLYEGPYKRMHSNGKPWIEANYLNNNHHGDYKAYYEDGTLRYEASYNYGRLHGIQKKYNKKGVLLSEITYNQDVKDGLAKFYDDKGNLLYVLKYKDDVVIEVDLR